MMGAPGAPPPDLSNAEIVEIHTVVGLDDS